MWLSFHMSEWNSSMYQNVYLDDLKVKLKLGHMGSKTRSLSQMIEKACKHSHFYAKTLIAVALHFTNAVLLNKALKSLHFRFKIV